MRDELTVLEGDSTLFIDVDSKQISAALPLVLNMNELQTLRSHDLLDLLLNLFR
jgi:hypothetical protein